MCLTDTLYIHICVKHFGMANIKFMAVCFVEINFIFCLISYRTERSVTNDYYGQLRRDISL